MSNVLSFYYKFLDFAARFQVLRFQGRAFLNQFHILKFLSTFALGIKLGLSLCGFRLSILIPRMAPTIKKLHPARLLKRCTFVTLSSNQSAAATSLQSKSAGKKQYFFVGRTSQQRVIFCLYGCRDDMGDIRVFINSLPRGLNFRHEVCMHYIVSHLSV